MRHVQANAEHVVRDMLRKVAVKFQNRTKDSDAQDQVRPVLGVPPVARPLVTLSAEDFMDDGSRVCLRLSIDGEKGEAHFDFADTGPEVLGNWNAPRAVTTAAVIYCLRYAAGVHASQAEDVWVRPLKLEVWPLDCCGGPYEEL